MVQSSTTTITPTVVSNCGYLYTAHGLGGIVHIGSCADTLSTSDVTHARVIVGDVFQLASIRETDGTPVVPAPISDNPSVVAPIAKQGGSASYRAVAPGTTTLRAATIFCNPGPTDTSPSTPAPRLCPVVQVTVQRTP